jgi:hypothetical protein
MMQELVLELDWCKLGSRVKALPGEGQNFIRYPLWQTIFFLAILSGLDTIAGGLKAVVYKDTIQALLLLFDSGPLTYWLF